MDGHSDNDSDIRDREDDVRLMILMFVSTFLILSLVGIIGITSCYLLCFDDDMDADSQNLEHLIQLTKCRITGLTVDQRKKLYKLREAIALSEARYKERHHTIYEEEPDSDEEIFNEGLGENDHEIDDSIEEDERENSNPYMTTTNSYHYASSVVDQLMYGRLSERVQVLPSGGMKLVLSEQFSAKL